MAATDKLFAGKIPEIYDRFLVPLIFESYAGDLASGWRRSNRGMYWRPLRAPARLLEPSHRGSPFTRALWLPISTSRCSIMPLRSSLPIVESYGSRPMG